MPIIEQTVGSGQAASFIPAEEELAAEGSADPERPQIGSLLRSLRGDRSLRQVEADTGVSNSYLCNLEGSLKKPGVKTLSKLASYYQISLQELLLAARTHRKRAAAPVARVGTGRAEKLRLRHGGPGLQPVDETP